MLEYEFWNPPKPKPPPPATAVPILANLPVGVFPLLKAADLYNSQEIVGQGSNSLELVKQLLL